MKLLLLSLEETDRELFLFKQAIEDYRRENWYIVGICNQDAVKLGQKPLEECFAEQEELIKSAAIDSDQKIIPDTIDFVLCCADRGNSVWKIMVNNFYQPSRQTKVFSADGKLAILPGIGFRRKDAGLILLSIRHYLDLYKDLEEICYIGNNSEDAEAVNNANNYLAGLNVNVKFPEIKYYELLRWKNNYQQLCLLS